MLSEQYCPSARLLLPLSGVKEKPRPLSLTAHTAHHHHLLWDHRRPTQPASCLVSSPRPPCGLRMSTFCPVSYHSSAPNTRNAGPSRNLPFGLGLFYGSPFHSLVLTPTLPWGHCHPCSPAAVVFSKSITHWGLLSDSTVLGSWHRPVYRW